MGDGSTDVPAVEHSMWFITYVVYTGNAQLDKQMLGT